ncbi:putative kinase [Kineococcus radiotolerans]|uniref:Putative kinase n=1 Tax=Kineococcus radiotolerans TaxID=131568 RepID=A0A7W4XUX6_KINRA|nr:ATP-binding protein [Kineococcus radiotolerans]MBB2899223.1 putative kinase [Kineococcus radiotolerans]
MDRATAILMVGLPGAGKTTRARHLEEHLGALRLTPDEWMIPLFGQSQPEGRRDVLEGRLLWTALRAAERGLNVVVDFGLWSRDERTALRWLFSAVGADCRIEYLPLDHDTQWERIQQRFAHTPEQTFTISAEELLDWRARFQEPTTEELEGAPPPAAPQPHANWSAWAAARWPSLPDIYGCPAD